MVLKRKNGRIVKTEEGVNIASPVVQGIRESDVRFEDILQEEEVCERVFRKESVAGANESNLSLIHCIFDHVIFSECRFCGAQLTDVRFENCDLSNVDFSDSMLYRVEFVGCKLMGTNLSDCVFNQVLFYHCNARYVNFSMGKMKHVLFAHSDLQCGSMESCRFVPVAFDTCNLTEAEFSRTPLKGIDFRSSQVAGIRLGIGDLKGVVVSSLQALELTRFLGLVVKDL